MNAEIARLIDHTLLKPEATTAQIRKLCDEARQYGFASVCVNPVHVELAARLLHGSPVKACVVTGFPLGALTPELKESEARQLVALGAGELDMVLNIGALKEGNYALVERDVRAVVDAAAGAACVKVIFENCLLEKREIVRACEICKTAGAAFVKTSTGFNKSGATVEDVRLMRETVGPDMGVKAAGGIRDLETALAMVEAGASRIGASASISIVTG